MVDFGESEKMIKMNRKMMYFLNKNIFKNLISETEFSTYLEPWSLLLEMKSSIRVQILDKAVYISLQANTHGKGMDPSLLPWAMSK